MQSHKSRFPRGLARRPAAAARRRKGIHPTARPAQPAAPGPAFGRVAKDYVFEAAMTMKDRIPRHFGNAVLARGFRQPVGGDFPALQHQANLLWVLQ